MYFAAEMEKVHDNEWYEWPPGPERDSWLTASNKPYRTQSYSHQQLTLAKNLKKQETFFFRASR